MEQSFYRIKRLPPYVFAQVNAQKAEARARGEDIIDLGMGNPDSAAPAHVVEKLRETALDPKTHRYSASRGIPGLRKALTGYYERRFQVSLNPDTEVVATIGSKEGLAHLAQAIASPGDVILVPAPSYPIHLYGFVLADATVRQLPKTDDMPFIDRLKRAVDNSTPKPLALVLNYPCNPTAETVDLAFYEEVVDFCRYHGIYILSDLAYCEIYFGDTPPPSILQVKGAKDIAVEFTSMSKTYSMAGWRVGFAAGNEGLITALARLKSYVDYGAFTPVQVAAAAALNGPQGYVDDLRVLYRERRDTMVECLSAAGWHVPVPDASMFIWAPVPEPFVEAGSLRFSMQLLQHAQVAVAPGIGFGEHGEGHVRIALVENKHRIRQACRNIRRFLHNNQETSALQKGTS